MHTNLKVGDRVTHKHNGMRGGIVTAVPKTRGCANAPNAIVVFVVWPGPWSRLGVCVEQVEKLVLA